MIPHKLVKNNVAVSFDLLEVWAPDALAAHREDPLCPCNPERTIQDGETIWLHDADYAP